MSTATLARVKAMRANKGPPNPAPVIKTRSASRAAKRERAKEGTPAAAQGPFFDLNAIKKRLYDRERMAQLAGFGGATATGRIKDGGYVATRAVISAQLAMYRADKATLYRNTETGETGETMRERMAYENMARAQASIPQPVLKPPRVVEPGEPIMREAFKEPEPVPCAPKKFSAYYMRDAIERPNYIHEQFREGMRGRNCDYDTIVGRGLSGALVVPNLARELGKKWCVVRKENDGSHSGNAMEGYMGTRWLFVDDLIASGRTLKATRDTIANVYRNHRDSGGERGMTPPAFAGVFLYATGPGIYMPPNHDRIRAALNY